MERCNICYEREAITRLSDKTAICPNCYDKVSEYLLKGTFTKIEALNSLKELEEYHNFISRFIPVIKNRSIAGRYLTAELQVLTPKDVIREMRITENNYSIDKLNKTRNCLTIPEHLKIIKELYPEEVSLIKPGNSIPEITRELIMMYLNNCNYLKW